MSHMVAYLEVAVRNKDKVVLSSLQEKEKEEKNYDEEMDDTRRTQKRRDEVKLDMTTFPTESKATFVAVSFTQS